MTASFLPLSANGKTVKEKIMVKSLSPSLSPQPDFLPTDRRFSGSAMGVETWVLLATLAVLAWVYSKWRHSYWSSRGVSCPPILPFIGHFHKEYFVGKKTLEYYTEVILMFCSEYTK